ncbi:MAG: CHASE2 domain-containing serine/threonine-protein kinase [Limisphaerales bacterium]
MPLLPQDGPPNPRGIPRVAPDLPPRSPRRKLHGILGAAIIALLALPLGRPLDHLSYDLPYLVRRPVIPEEAVIVTMDLQSHIDLQQRPEQRWSRKLHAQLIDRIAAHQPRAIVLDSVFMEPEVQGAEADANLVDAVRRAGNVAVAATVEPFVRDGASGFQVIPPFSPLRTVAQWGPPRYPESGTIRESIPSPDGRPTLARTVVRMIRPDDPSSTNAAPPRFWLNHYGPPGSLPRIPYAAVLRGEFEPDQFRDRIVFVGADYKGPFPTAGISPSRSGIDHLATPYTRFTRVKASGVEIVATEVLNLLRGDMLRRWPAWTEWSVFTLVGVASVLGFSLVRPVPAAVGSLVLALAVSAYGLFSVAWTQTWFAWWVPAFAEVPFALAWCHVLGRAEVPHRPAAPSPAPAPFGASVPGFNPENPSIPGYTLLREIGRGGYGTVWLARDLAGVLRAVKVVRRSSSGDPAAADREFQGIRRYSPLSLRHPGFTPILHVGRDDSQGFFYYVMEAADDQVTGASIDPDHYNPRTLRSEIDRHGFLSVERTLEIGIALGQALAHLHQNRLVHRDVKPANVLFVRGRARLADIGLVTGLADHPREVSQVGTPDYIPDEGTGTVTAEIFALGKLLSVVVTGKPASQFGELPTGFDQRADLVAFKKLNSILLTACDPDPRQRFQSMEAMVAALEGIRS